MDGCSEISRVPTASDPPGAQSEHDELAVGQRARQCPATRSGSGQHRAFEQEHGADLRHGKSQRAQHADLAHALLHAQLEEQAGQQQRGDHQEEAEVDEVLAEIGGALRGFQALRARTGMTVRPIWAGSSAARSAAA